MTSKSGSEDKDGPAGGVWLLRTPSHGRLVLAERESEGEWSAAVPTDTAGNYSWEDITEAVREFVTLNPEWVRAALRAGEPQ